MLIKWTQQIRSDIMGISEVGINFGAKQQQRSFRKMVSSHGWQGMTVNAYNEHDTREGRMQPGGVAILVASRINHLVTDTGKDETGLGRWVWIELTGANGEKIRVYQLYRCLPHARFEGSVFRQQQNYLISQHDRRSPYVAMMEDL